MEEVEFTEAGEDLAALEGGNKEVASDTMATAMLRKLKSTKRSTSDFHMKRPYVFCSDCK